MRQEGAPAGGVASQYEQRPADVAAGVARVVDRKAGERLRARRRKPIARRAEQVTTPNGDVATVGAPGLGRPRRRRVHLEEEERHVAGGLLEAARRVARHAPLRGRARYRGGVRHAAAAAGGRTAGGGGSGGGGEVRGEARFPGGCRSGHVGAGASYRRVARRRGDRRDDDVAAEGGARALNRGNDGRQGPRHVDGLVAGELHVEGGLQVGGDRTQRVRTCACAEAAATARWRVDGAARREQRAARAPCERAVTPEKEPVAELADLKRLSGHDTAAEAKQGGVRPKVKEDLTHGKGALVVGQHGPRKVHARVRREGDRHLAVHAHVGHLRTSGRLAAQVATRHLARGVAAWRCEGVAL